MLATSAASRSPSRSKACWLDISSAACDRQLDLAAPQALEGGVEATLANFPGKLVAEGRHIGDSFDDHVEYQPFPVAFANHVVDRCALAVAERDSGPDASHPIAVVPGQRQDFDLIAAFEVEQPSAESSHQ